MALSQQDRTDISDLISLHGHLTDAGELDQAGELFTPDVTYDLGDFGRGSLHGAAQVREAALALGSANPVGHHVTNIVITEADDHSARVASKGIGISADGTAGSVTYDDIVTRQPGGWKISYRKVTARRAALGGQEAGPREALERFRQAAISQSADDMRRVYAADAVHEFPFTRPGAPSRLEGRDEIVNWIAAGWKASALKYERYRTIAVRRTSDPATIIGRRRVSARRSAVEDRPADAVAQSLVVKHEVADRPWKPVTLPPALGPARGLRRAVRRGGPRGLDRVGGRAEVVGGDVRHGARLPGRVRGVARCPALVSRRPHGMAARRAGLRHRDLAAGPGAGMTDGLPRPRVPGVSRLEQVQDVLSASRRPQGEQVVIAVRQGPAAADRHQARVAHLRQDHGRAPFRPGGQHPLVTA